MMRILSLVLLFSALWSPPECAALDRCVELVPDVRAASFRILGVDFPYHYNLGALRLESNCRGEVTAFDGGQGIAQFMPSTARALAKGLGETFDPYDRGQSIRMHALYIRDLSRSNPAPGRPLWITYQAYNGGSGLLKKEAKRAGSWTWEPMRAACQRNVLTLKNGAKLDLCKVNYDYSVRVYRYGQKYRVLADSRRFRFW